MKRIVITALMISVFLSMQSQEIGWERKSDIRSLFESNWLRFRALNNPLIPDSVIRNARGSFSFLLPGGFFMYYRTDITITRWGMSRWFEPVRPGSSMNQFIDIPHTFYLVEKTDGLTGVKWEWFADNQMKDTIHVNVYDSIFPFDNRFLIRRGVHQVTGEQRFSFHSGNVEWGDWRDAIFMRRVDFVGYIRGAQFGIENVFVFRQDFSDKIRNFRPEFPDFVYTSNRYTASLLGNSDVIIGAPEGREDEHVEFIFYSNIYERTGDPDVENFYEIRFVLPTHIQSIKERRFEHRLLTEEEKQFILNRENNMRRFIERRTRYMVLPEEDEDEIIAIVSDVEEEDNE